VFLLFYDLIIFKPLIIRISWLTLIKLLFAWYYYHLFIIYAWPPPLIVCVHLRQRISLLCRHPINMATTMTLNAYVFAIIRRDSRKTTSVTATCSRTTPWRSASRRMISLSLWRHNVHSRLSYIVTARNDEPCAINTPLPDARIAIADKQRTYERVLSSRLLLRHLTFAVWSPVTWQCATYRITARRNIVTRGSTRARVIPDVPLMALANVRRNLAFK